MARGKAVKLTPEPPKSTSMRGRETLDATARVEAAAEAAAEVAAEAEAEAEAIAALHKVRTRQGLRAQAEARLAEDARLACKVQLLRI